MIRAVPLIDPSQLFGGGGTEGGTTSATGCPNRVMSTGFLVRRTLSRTARQVALNWEMAMLSMENFLPQNISWSRTMVKCMGWRDVDFSSAL
jgi:hypothetical protein